MAKVTRPTSPAGWSPTEHVLPRFRGYDARLTAARARSGGAAWVDRTDVDSCHRVWLELHEGLVATLGIERTSTFNDPAT